MNEVLRIVLVEDYDSDAELVKRHIAKAGIKFAYEVVETRSAFITALRDFKPDLILSDYTLPQFSGMDALLIRKEMAPLVPFVLVTGSLNEDIAVECMRAGADDYVLKQNLTRLVSAIEAAIQKQENIRLKIEAEKALAESERTFRQLYSNMSEGVSLYKMVYDKEGKPVNYRVESVNRQFERIVNIPENKLVGKLSTEIENNPVPFNVKEYKKVANEETTMLFETHYQPLGKRLLISVSPWKKDGFAAIVTDLTQVRKTNS